MSEDIRTKSKAFLFDSRTGHSYELASSSLLSVQKDLTAFLEVNKAATSNSTGSKRLMQKYGTMVGGVKVASRPFDFATYAFAATLNTYHARASRAKAKDIVGRPWQLVGEATVAKKMEIEAFFKTAFVSSFGKTFGEGMMDVEIDYQSLGNGYLEVVPSVAGFPAELTHIPATEVWIRLDRLGYVQALNGEYTHFRAWGVPEASYEALSETDPLSSGKGQACTALIHFSSYWPFSPYYGLPSIMPAWNAVVILQLIAEYNLQFFGNNAIPDYAVIVSGEASDDLRDVIKTYFQSHLKGQAHKTLVIDTPSGQSIKFEKLTSDGVKDGSFRLLRTDCRDEILHAHGVPPQKVGIVETGKLGGNLASEQIEEYKQTIVTPGQERVETRLNTLIAAFDSSLIFQFTSYDNNDLKTEADIDAIYLDRNVVTPNEVRTLRFPDQEPLPGGDGVLHPTTLGDAASLEATVSELQQAIYSAVGGDR